MLIMERIFKNEFALLKQMLHRYLFQAEYLPTSGGYHSKIWAAILFYQYARYSQDLKYEELADELLETICNGIVGDSPVNFGFGLSGLAWGIGYLRKENFIKGDMNDILAEIDSYIMERNVYRIKDLSFDTGLSGINFYVEWRVNFAVTHGMPLPFDEIYLNDWSVVRSSQPLEYYKEEKILLKMWNKMKFIYQNT